MENENEDLDCFIEVEIEGQKVVLSALFDGERKMSLSMEKEVARALVRVLNKKIAELDEFN